jgi:hypothetical protein
MGMYHTMILILPRAHVPIECSSMCNIFSHAGGDTCHRVIRWLVNFFPDWQNATTGRASCICRRFKSFKSFKSFRGLQGQENQCHRG